MNVRVSNDENAIDATTIDDSARACGKEPDLVRLLFAGAKVTPTHHPFPAVLIGEIVAMLDDGYTPLVVYPGKPGSAAVRARAVVELQSSHVGRSVVLMFEDGEGTRPVVMGVVRQDEGRKSELPSPVEVDADGERLVVTANQQLVLRCGKASITLTRAGKVLIEGTYLSSRSTGANRIMGGSVRIN